MYKNLLVLMFIFISSLDILNYTIASEVKCYPATSPLNSPMKVIVFQQYEIDPMLNFSFDGTCVYQNIVSLANGEMTYGDRKFCENVAQMSYFDDALFSVDNAAGLSMVDSSSILIERLNEIKIEYQKYFGAGQLLAVAKNIKNLRGVGEYCGAKDAPEGMKELYLEAIKSKECEGINSKISSTIANWNKDIQSKKYEMAGEKPPASLDEVRRLFAGDALEAGSHVGVYLEVLGQGLDHNDELFSSKKTLQAGLRKFRKEGWFDRDQHNYLFKTVVDHLLKYPAGVPSGDSNGIAEESNLLLKMKKSPRFLSTFFLTMCSLDGKCDEAVSPFDVVRDALSKAEKNNIDKETIINLFKSEYENQNSSLSGKDQGICLDFKQNLSKIRDGYKKLCKDLKSGNMSKNDTDNKLSCIDQRIREELDPKRGARWCYNKSRHLCALKFGRTLKYEIADASYYLKQGELGEAVNKRLVKRYERGNEDCDRNHFSGEEGVAQKLISDTLERHDRDRTVKENQKILPKHCKALGISVKDCYSFKRNVNAVASVYTADRESSVPVIGGIGAVSSNLSNRVGNSKSQNASEDMGDSSGKDKSHLDSVIEHVSKENKKSLKVRIKSSVGEVKAAFRKVKVTTPVTGSGVAPIPVVEEKQIEKVDQLVSNLDDEAAWNDYLPKEMSDNDYIPTINPAETIVGDTVVNSVEESGISKDELISKYESVIDKLSKGIAEKSEGKDADKDLKDLVEKLQKDMETKKVEIAELKKNLEKLEKESRDLPVVASGSPQIAPVQNRAISSGPVSPIVARNSSRQGRAALGPAIPQNSQEVVPVINNIQPEGGASRSGSHQVVKNSRTNGDSIITLPTGESTEGRSIASISETPSLVLKMDKLSSWESVINNPDSDIITLNTVSSMIDDQGLSDEDLADLDQNVIIIKDKDGNQIYQLEKDKERGVYKKTIPNKATVEGRLEYLKNRLSESIQSIDLLNSLQTIAGKKGASSNSLYAEMMNVLDKVR